MSITDNTVKLLNICKEKGIHIATAESCTGGLLSSKIVDISGASTVFDRGFITYSNQSKIDLLGVSEEIIEKYGAVSSQTAIKMAEGAITHSNSELSVAITGIAGPEGGSEDKPVGLVYIATAMKGSISACEKYVFDENRINIRQRAVDSAIMMLLQCAGGFLQK